MAGRIAPGTTVTWTSQSQGTSKTKTGTVIAFWPAGTTPTVGTEDGYPIPASRIKFDMRATTQDRYLVAVPRGGQSEMLDYYAPPAKWLEK